MEEVNLVRSRRVDIEGIDRDPLTPDSQLHVRAFQECGQLPVAVAKIQDDDSWVVLLQLRDQEIEQKALPAARRSQHHSVTNILDVKVEEVGRLFRRFEYGQCLGAKMRAHLVTAVLREDKTQIGSVRFQ